MTRKQRHLLTRIIVAAVLFLAGSLLHLPELAEMAVFLVCYVVVGWDIVWKAITNILHALDWYSRSAAFIARRTVRADNFVVEIIRLNDFCSISSCTAITSCAAGCF